jgi:DNA polymerase III delta subunit
MAREPDPQTLLTQLESSLRTGPLARGYILRGEEPYFRVRAQEAILTAARQRNLDTCLHDTRAGGFDLQALLGDLCSPSMFAAERCVVLEAPESLLAKQEGREPATAKAIRSFLELRRGSIVLLADSLRADNATVKAIVAAGGSLLTFRSLYESPPPWARNPDPRGSELCLWTLSRARELNVRLSPDQALLLVTARGNDLHAIEGELQAMRSGGGELLRRLESDAPAVPYKVAEAVLCGDLPRALVGIETLFRGGIERDSQRQVEPKALLAIFFASLRGSLRQNLAGAAAIAAGLDVEAAAAEAGVPGAPGARQAFLRAQSLRRDWRAMQDDLCELERRSRSSAEVDASDLARFALRWRARARSGTRSGAGAG